MATNEEIYSIVLKLRDDMSGSLQKTRQGLDDTTKGADKASKGFDLMRNQVGRLRSMLLATFGVGGGVALVTSAISGWYEHQRRINEEIRKSAETLPVVKREMDLVTAAIERMNIELAKSAFGTQDEAELARKMGLEKFTEAYIDKNKKTIVPAWMQNLFQVPLPGGGFAESEIERLTRQAADEFVRLTSAAKGAEEATQRALQMAGVAPNVTGAGLGPYMSQKKSYSFGVEGLPSEPSPFFKLPFQGFKAGGGFAAFNATLPVQIYLAQQKAMQASLNQDNVVGSPYAGGSGSGGFINLIGVQIPLMFMKAEQSAKGFEYGFSKAVHQMRQDAQNFAMLGQEAGQMFSSSLVGNMEMFLNTLALGKASFKDFSKSVILDLLAIVNHMVAMQLASKFLSFLPASWGGGYQFGTPVEKSMASAGIGGGSRGGLTIVHVHGLSGAEVMATLSTAPGVRAVRSITAAGMTASPGYRSAMLGMT